MGTALAAGRVMHWLVAVWSTFVGAVGCYGGLGGHGAKVGPDAGERVAEPDASCLDCDDDAGSGADAGCSGDDCCPTGRAACGDACVDLASDAENCGGCGLACPTGCSDGSCLVELASGQTLAFGIALDVQFVYWASRQNGTVMRVPKIGGEATRLGGGNWSVGVAVDATHVYWTDHYGNDVARAPLAGGETVMLATGQGETLGIAVDEAWVYYNNSFGRVMKVPLAGGTPVELATSQTPTGLALGSTHVYWADPWGGVIGRVPRDGGDATIIAQNQGMPDWVAVDETYVYWTTSTGGTVERKPIGSVPQDGTRLTLASGQDHPAGIAVDATHVYWTNMNPNGTVMKVPIDGGEPATLAAGQDRPIGIAIDETSVYWVTEGGSVMRLTPR